MIKQIKKCLLGLLSLSLFSFFASNLINGISVRTAKAETETEQKQYCQATIEDNFDDRTIMLVVDGGTSQFKGINSSLGKRIREEVEILEIENLTEFSDELLEADGD